MACGSRCAVLAALLVGCAVEVDEPIELAGVARAGEVLLADATGATTTVDDDSLCACDGDACRVDWVLEHIGCDVCVVVRCADDTPASPGEIPPDPRWQHACAACPSPWPRAPDGVDAPTSASVAR